MFSDDTFACNPPAFLVFTIAAMSISSSRLTEAREKLTHEFKQFLVISLYLALFFSVFRAYKRLILGEFHITVFDVGYAIFQAMALGKIVLIGEVLGLGRRFHDRPLIVPTVFRSLVFCAVVLVFTVVEHMARALFHGQSIGDGVDDFLAMGWAHIVSSLLVVFVAFLPFFGLREAERVLGEGKLVKLFFRRKHEPEVVRS